METKIRKGQAFNLAVMTAIAAGKAGDNQYIFSQFIRYYELAGLLQEADIEDVKEILKI